MHQVHFRCMTNVCDSHTIPNPPGTMPPRPPLMAIPSTSETKAMPTAMPTRFRTWGVYTSDRRGWALRNHAFARLCQENIRIVLVGYNLLRTSDIRKLVQTLEDWTKWSWIVATHGYWVFGCAMSLFPTMFGNLRTSHFPKGVRYADVRTRVFWNLQKFRRFAGHPAGRQRTAHPDTSVAYLLLVVSQRVKLSFFSSPLCVLFVCLFAKD